MNIEKQMNIVKFFAEKGNLVITKHSYNDNWFFGTHYKNGMGEADSFEKALYKLIDNVMLYLKEHEQKELIRLLEKN